MADLFLVQKLARLRAASTQMLELCSRELSRQTAAELDLVVRSVVADVRDVQLTLGCVPPPASDDAVPLRGGPSQLRVGPLEFPPFAADRAPPPDAPPAAPPSRMSLGAWDFSLGPPEGESERVVGGGTEQRRQRVPVRGGEDDEEYREDAMDDDDGPSGRRTPKPRRLPAGQSPGPVSGTPGAGGAAAPPAANVASAAKRKARGPKHMVDNPVCGHCNTKNTPEWRSGPNGILLCNACGLKWSRKRQKPDGK